MTDEAAAKKKKGCLGLILKWTLGFTAFGIVAVIVSEVMTGAQISGCNDGKAEDCQSLLEDKVTVDEDFDVSRITNEEFKPKFVAQVEAAKKAAARRKAGNPLVKAMAACQNSLKAAMKDPDSFQVHNRDFATLQIEYSATNSFGGRIRNVMDCRTGKNLR